MEIFLPAAEVVFLINNSISNQEIFYFKKSIFKSWVDLKYREKINIQSKDFFVKPLTKTCVGADLPTHKLRDTEVSKQYKTRVRTSRSHDRNKPSNQEIC